MWAVKGCCGKSNLIAYRKRRGQKVRKGNRTTWKKWSSILNTRWIWIARLEL